MQIQSLASLSGLRIQHCLELWCKSQMRLRSRPTLLWLWGRLVATAPIRPLAWERPYATGAALEKAKRQKKKQKTKTKLIGSSYLWPSGNQPNWDASGCRSLASFSGLRIGVAVSCDVGQQLQLQFNPWPGSFHIPQVWS